MSIGTYEYVNITFHAAIGWCGSTYRLMSLSNQRRSESIGKPYSSGRFVVHRQKRIDIAKDETIPAPAKRRALDYMVLVEGDVC